MTKNGKLREALLRIRKIRRETFMPNHEQDEIYNIAMEALNYGEILYKREDVKCNRECGAIPCYPLYSDYDCEYLKPYPPDEEDENEKMP